MNLMPIHPQRDVQRHYAASHHHAPSFWLTLVLFASSLLLVLSACGGGPTQGASTPSPTANTVAMAYGQVHTLASSALSTTVVNAHQHLYTFSKTNVGLMYPATDAQGNIWIGEMNANSLGYLNTQTGQVKSWALPDGHYGVMATAIDSQGNIWYAEQFANYIGRFDPKQQTFHPFLLGTMSGHPIGPLNVQFDAQGILWFTAADGNAIGRLDPQTGAVRLWSIMASPSGLAVAPNGSIWFGYLDNGVIGNLNPGTNQITLYKLANTQAQIYSMTADSQGHLWFTEASPGQLDMFDPATSTLTTFAVPTVDGGSPALSELAIDQHGHVWFVDVGANMLGCYLPEQHHYIFYRLSLGQASPFALTIAANGAIWFTAGNADGNYLGTITV